MHHAVYQHTQQYVVQLQVGQGSESFSSIKLILISY